MSFGGSTSAAITSLKNSRSLRPSNRRYSYLKKKKGTFTLPSSNKKSKREQVELEMALKKAVAKRKEMIYYAIVVVGIIISVAASFWFWN